MPEITPSEITPEHLYWSRRQFIGGMGALLASSALAACGRPTPTATPTRPASRPAPGSPADELGYPLTPYETVTTYNNYYEFSLRKESVAELAKDLKITPWTVQVGGLVNKPRVFGLEDLLRFPQEERIYRLRCVEAWSMVIPWVGFPLRQVLDTVEPMSKAQYVRFETLYDPQQMLGQRSTRFAWPYAEGLRLDEAMHDLTLLSTGLYGKTLLPQNGAPIRLVVPWKYGFKDIKSIVKIELVQEMPVSLWMAAAPDEYGFFANVNPRVDHPRWSQATERLIGDDRRVPTLMFNGYGAEVGHLYNGMDLNKWF